jgi:thioredoxin-dependent peroxiredoxin
VNCELYVKTYMGVNRSHFVIDEQGKIVAADIGVKATESVEHALTTLDV